MFPYRHDSYFYYMSGFPEPEAVIALVADADGDRHRAVLPREGSGTGDLGRLPLRPDAAREIFGFDEAHPIAELDRSCPSSRPTGPRCTRRSDCSPHGTGRSPTC
jgi:Xaa-Pro aminopeptidase